MAGGDYNISGCAFQAKYECFSRVFRMFLAVRATSRPTFLSQVCSPDARCENQFRSRPIRVLICYRPISAAH